MAQSLKLFLSMKLRGAGLALGLSVALIGMTTARMATAQEISQTYVAPWLFSGSLYVSTAEQPSKHQLALLEQELDAGQGTLVCIGLADEGSMTELATFLRAQPWKNVAMHSVASLEEATEQQRLCQTLEELDSASCVLVDDTALACGPSSTRRWLGERLRNGLQRQVTVCVEHASSGDESAARADRCQPIASELDLLPQMQLLYRSEEVVDSAVGDHLTVALPDKAWLRIHGRELFNLSDAGPLTFVYPKTNEHPDESVQSLPPRAMCDLVAMRRTLYQRAHAPFPSDQPYDHRLTNGSLVIVGGGGTSLEIWEKFIELAGGADAKIVVLPTAVPEPEEDPYEARVFQRLGVREVRVLTETDRMAVSDPHYLENFEWATGVWYGGGRQWRFVDAYWGTPAWQAMIDVVRRGGVIGGSSAGATIQGDLLVRGHPLGNHIMVADGYRHGLGLLPGVAIDQHFRERNRFDDLAQVVQRFPTILGVGIDEDTALVVEAPSRCSVMGKGSVWLTRQPQDNQPRQFTQHRSGSHFDLVAP